MQSDRRIPSLHLAGLGRRFVAGLLDLAVASGLVAAVFGGWAAFVHVELPRWTGIWWDWLLQIPHVPDPYLMVGAGLSVLVALAVLCYVSVLWQGSPGQRLLGLKVVDPAGRPPGWGRWVARFVALTFSFGYLLLGVLWIAFDRLHQGWHDKLAGTFVVLSSAPGSLQVRWLRRGVASAGD